MFVLRPDDESYVASRGPYIFFHYTNIYSRQVDRLILSVLSLSIQSNKEQKDVVEPVTLLPSQTRAGVLVLAS
jgi:hypothetical protein